jgi:hypothetical protein
MAYQIKDLDDTFPDGSALEYFFDGHALNVACLDAVKLSYYIPEIYVAHPAASSKSPKLQVVLATPAAIAGVQRFAPDSASGPLHRA